MKKVLDWLTENDSQLIGDLAKLVAVPSISTDGEHQQEIEKVAELTCELMRSAGLNNVGVLRAGDSNPYSYGEWLGAPGKPTIFLYAHHDVQPVNFIEDWKSEPWTLTEREGRFFGRGAADDKGAIVVQLGAIAAWLKTTGSLPVNIKMLVEGEEGVGSRNLDAFFKENKDRLMSDVIVVCDTENVETGYPCLTYSLRGITAFEITLHGRSRDLHSGGFGGAVENPAMALARLLATVRNDKGRITIPGFYDGVKPLTRLERQQAALYPLKDAQLKKIVGAPQLFGEAGFTATEQRSSRPTFEINGLTSGYQGDGSKTIVPSWARAKITCRLVPNQDPEHVRKIVIAHLKKHCPPTVRMEIEAGHGADAYRVLPGSRPAQAALRALEKAFHRKPILLREGGSIPIVNQFKKILGVDSLLLGLGLPDDNAHSPNEKFDLDCFEKGQLMSAYLWQELSGG